MAFSFMFQYPNGVNPEFSVYSIEGGYQFVFHKEDGTEKSKFSIDAGTIENPNAVTGHEGDEANAIEIFRDSLKP